MAVVIVVDTATVRADLIKIVDPKEEKKKMLEEATGVSEWIYTVIRKLCAE